MPSPGFPVVRMVRALPRDGMFGPHRFCGRIAPVAPGDAAAVEAVASAQGPLAAGLNPLSGPGLRNELASRPGREVSAWLAWEGGSAARALGLVALVAAGQGPRLRHSIAWLLVDPRDRRGGVGTALVTVALDAAACAGASEVWVETHAAWPAATAFWQRLDFRPR